jgi:hypothetical protein
MTSGEMHAREEKFAEGAKKQLRFTLCLALTSEVNDLCGR